jgi:transcription elongation factor Elf1
MVSVKRRKKAPRTVVGVGNLRYYTCWRCGKEVKPKSWKYINIDGDAFCKRCYLYYKDGGWIK